MSQNLSQGLWKPEGKTDNQEVQCLSQGDAEKEAKLESAFCPFYRTHSPHKVTVVVTFAACVLIILVLVVALTVRVFHSHEPPVLSCPDSWVGYQRKCYYFSEAEGNWDVSQSQCSDLGASLAGIDSQKELTFLLRRKGCDIHWIGLRREGGQPWKWANGTEFNNLFEVKGGGDCAYLNDIAISSSRCLTTKKWVCSKPSRH